MENENIYNLYEINGIRIWQHKRIEGYLVGTNEYDIVLCGTKNEAEELARLGKDHPFWDIRNCFDSGYEVKEDLMKD